MLNNLYSDNCCGGHIVMAAPPSLAALAKQAAEKIWKQKAMPDGKVDLPLIKEVANNLMQGMFAGFDKDGADYDTPDQKMLQKLTGNVWHFSAAKNYTQLRELSNALVGTDGKLRSFSDFMAAANEINDKHITRYLKAEYELAVSGSQMAGKWVDIEEQKAVLPYLEFDAIIDSQTTDLCRSLNGTLLPVDHPFWKTYYPPNHFGERSTVRQRATGKVTDADKIPGADIPDMFKSNLGQQGLIFPKDHAYFKDLPPEVFENVRKIMPYDQQFDKVKSGSKGFIRQHYDVNTQASEYKASLEIASDFMKKGSHVDLMPVITKDTDQRAIIFHDAKPGKSPDLRINKVLYEIKEPQPGFKFNTLKHSISDAAKQADHVIIKLTDKVDHSILQRLSKGRFLDHKSLLEVLFKLANGEYVSFKRTDFIK